MPDAGYWILSRTRLGFSFLSGTSFYGFIRHPVSEIRPLLFPTMISLSHVSKFYGRQDLLRDVSLSINPGERIALVGVNGAGKTTLFKILLGDIEPDQGQVHRKKGFRLGYLPQDIVELRGKSVLQQVLDVDVRFSKPWPNSKKYLISWKTRPIRPKANTWLPDKAISFRKWSAWGSMIGSPGPSRSWLDWGLKRNPFWPP